MTVANSKHAQQMTGVVLAGGQGTRMGGHDKGLLTLGHQTLVENAVARIQPQVTALLIVANRNIQTYGQYGIPIIQDEPPAYRGPLGGLVAALDQAATPWVLVTPCDCPKLPVDLAARLWQGATANEAAMAVARDGERTHPLLALIHTSLLTDLRAYLATGGRAVHQWQAQHTTIAVDFSDCPDAFANMNTPADLSGLSE